MITLSKDAVVEITTNLYEKEGNYKKYIEV